MLLSSYTQDSSVKIPTMPDKHSTAPTGMVFTLINNKERARVVKMVMQEDFSLGMVDPSSGRLQLII